VTTRRILERVSVYYVSRRMAWKLLKGASFFASSKFVPICSLEKMIIMRINI